MSEREPTELDPIANAIDALRTDLRTLVPGIVVKYNPATQRADVQPAIKCLTVDGKLVTLPQVVEAPVAWPRGGGYAMHWPLKPGDTVGLLVADRAIDLWLTQGGITDPRDLRRHELTDAIVLPGLNTDLDPNVKAKPAEAMFGREDGSATVLVDEAGGVTLEAATTVKIGSIAAALAVARVTDTLTGSAAAAAWALVVEGAINALAPGTFTGANSWLATVAPPGGLGTIATGSGKVTSD